LLDERSLVKEFSHARALSQYKYGLIPHRRDKVFYDRETWEAMFQESLTADPSVADSLAWLLFRVIKELNQRKRGRVINTLKL